MTQATVKNLLLFTTGYPYGKQVETFIDSELETMSHTFEQVYIFPSCPKEQFVRPIPANFKIIHLDTNWAPYKNRLLYSNLFLIVNILLQEFVNSTNKILFISQIKKFKNMLLHRLFESEQLKKIIVVNDLSEATYYSYWLNDWTITLGILKYKKTIKEFISRAHGFDIYEDRWPGQMIPFRYFQFKMIKHILSVSQKGSTHLKSKTVFPEKISVSYLGVPEQGTNPYDEVELFTIVSCSNPIPLKRVHLIVEILKHVTIPVRWVHFGDGKSLEFIKNKAEELPLNISYEFKGHVHNQEVLNYYRNNSINLFIIVSEIEGLPMSLIEACSFGIPVLGTNVGGIPEIINDKTGIVIPKDFSPESVAQLIMDFEKSVMNSVDFRAGVKEFWFENFNSNINYENFYNTLIKK